MTAAARYTVKLVRDPSVTYDVANTPDKAAALAREILEDEPSEAVVVIALDQRQRPIGWRVTFRGTIAACSFDPREILQFALLVNAKSIVVAHNHPSGDPSPSTQDATATTKLAKACRVVGVPLMDHIVVGHGNAKYSFREHGASL